MGRGELPSGAPGMRGSRALVAGLGALFALLLAGCVTGGATVSPTASVAEGARVAPSVSNVSFRQEGTGIVITYDLAAGAPKPVTLRASGDGGNAWDVNLGHLSGDVGEGVRPGTGKTIVWAALKDYPDGRSFDALVFELGTTGNEWVDPFTGMVFVFVEGGYFEMGDTLGGGDGDEKPVHTVTLADFYLGKTEVTQAQWEKVMGSNPSKFKGAEHPVEQVSWKDVQEFIRKLNRRSGNRYRLPTEAEWEYAARSGGKKEKWAGTSNESQLGAYAWYGANSGSQTHSVGQKQPNGLGLYDMSGNVWEWCSDWYGDTYYGQSPKKNPKGPSSGEHRVLRGGSWYSDPVSARAADRVRLWPTGRVDSDGFRLALASPPP